MNTNALMRHAPGRRAWFICLVVALWISIGLPTVGAQELLVANGPNILVYGRAASGNVYPFRTFGALIPIQQRIPALAVDAVNNEVVALVETGPNQASSAVSVYSRTADGSTAPIRGLGTGLGGSTAVAVDTLHDEIYITHEHNFVPGSPPKSWSTAVRQLAATPRSGRSSVWIRG